MRAASLPICLWLIWACCGLGLRAAYGQLLENQEAQEYAAPAEPTETDGYLGPQAALNDPAWDAAPAYSQPTPPPPAPADAGASFLPNSTMLGVPPGQCAPNVISEGWCRRPIYGEVLIGLLFGDEFVPGQIEIDPSFLGGVRLGYDLDGAWAIETRLALADVEIQNVAAPANPRAADMLMWDVDLVHYFHSTAVWRPYLSVGLGLVQWQWADVENIAREEKIANVPVAIGLQKRVDDWLVFRLDLADNIGFGGGEGLGTQHNFTLSAAVEFRYGGTRTSYWPWYGM